MLLWVIGGGGLLGSHLRAALRHHFPQAQLWQSTPLHFSWHDKARLAAELKDSVAAFAAAVGERASAWGVFWCAGKGIVSSAAAALEPEWSAWNRLLELLGPALARPDHARLGTIFLASSAGAVYSDDGDDFLTEDSSPIASSAYGVHKLRMEDAVRDWIAAFPAVSCLIGRLSTLYGPGQDLHKPQGIISHLSRCLIHRRAVEIYVPLDTRRDYLFVRDCAHEIAASTGRLLTECRGSAVTKIFASEEPTTLARIIGVFFQMAKHRPLIVCRQPLGAQPRSLKFRSQIWRDLENPRTDLATGIHLVHEHQLGLFQKGLLPGPA